MLSSSHLSHTGFSVLNTFLDEVVASSLEQQAKHDVNKVIACFTYIMENSSYITFAVDNQNDASIYSEDPHAAKNDFKKRVLRDSLHTSFHLALRKKGGALLTGQEWMQEMQRIMEQIEYIILTLPSSQMRLEFAKQFIYKDETGCLDERIKFAMDWAEEVLLSSANVTSPVMKLDFLMRECLTHYPNNTSVRFYDFAEAYLKKQKHIECLHEGKILPITPALLKKYAIYLGFEEEEQEDKSDASPEEKKEETKDKHVDTDSHQSSRAAYYTHIKNAKIIRGQAGMLQHHFSNQMAAMAFLDWIKSQSMMDVDKCKISHEKHNKQSTYMVRLSEAQLAMTAAELSKIPIQSRLTEKQLTELSTKLLDSAQHSPTEFIELIRTHFMEEISVAYCMESNKWTLLHVAAQYQSAEAFIALINKASPEAINAALIMENNYKGNPLCYAARHQSAGAFIALINKASPEAINTALIMEDNYKWTLLHYTARYQSAEAFIALINKASPEAINAALIMENNYKWTPLHLAAHCQSAEAFIALINKASPEAINAALIMENNYKWTPLHLAASGQSAEAFIALINKASPEAINAALIMEDDAKWTPLHTIVCCQPAEALIAFLNKADPNVINQAIPICTNDGNNFLLNLLSYQPDNLIVLLHPQYAAGLNNACLNNPILGTAFLYQPPSLIADLLNLIDDSALQFQLTPPQLTSSLITAIASCMLHESSWQKEPLLSRLCQFLGKDLMGPIYQAWLGGIDIPASVLSVLQPYFTTMTDQKRDPFEVKQINKHWQSLINAKEVGEEKIAPLAENEIAITCKSGIKIALGSVSDADVDRLWQDGLDSPLDYHRLHKHLPDHIITQVASDMHRANLLYIGCLGKRATEDYPDLSLEQKRIASVIAQGNALIKVIKAKHWEDFRKQLLNYNYRPSLRKMVDKTAFKYKLLHRTQTLIEHQSHAHVEKTYLATKKQSATYLSRHLCTAIFGDQHAGLLKVGILYDMDFDFEIVSSMPSPDQRKSRQYILLHNMENKAWQFFYIDDDKKPHQLALQSAAGLEAALTKLPKASLENISPSEKAALKNIIACFDDARMNKALFTQDTGTFTRSWITKTKEEARKYQTLMKKVMVKDMPTLRADAEKNPYKLNEILRKFTRYGLRTIFTRTDTPEARALARQYRDDVRSDCPIDLLINHYDPLLRKLRLYSPRQQQDDIKGYSITQHNEENIRLEAIIKAELLSLLGGHHDPEVQALLADALTGKSTWQATKLTLLEMHYRAVLQQADSICSQKTSWHASLFGSNKQPKIIQVADCIAEAKKGGCSYSDAYQKITVLLGAVNPNSMKNSDDIGIIKKLTEVLGQKLFSSFTKAMPVPHASSSIGKLLGQL